jgi:hypothetical protein
MEYILDVHDKYVREMNPKKQRFETSIRCLNDVRDSDIAANKMNKTITRKTFEAAYAIAKKWNEKYTKMGHRVISNTVVLNAL